MKREELIGVIVEAPSGASTAICQDGLWFVNSKASTAPYGWTIRYVPEANDDD